MEIPTLDKAVTKLQQLVNGVNDRWQGKGGIGTKEAFEIVEEIHEILNGDEK